MPLIKAVKIAGISELTGAATIITAALVVYLAIEVYKNYKETKVLAQQKKINEYKLMEYSAKYPKS